jgi:DNA repair exonuclease SbcCD ATPase subunit
MPSIILDDFLNDIKIELQLAHKSSVDDKNLDMIHKVFGQIKKLKKERDFFQSEFHKTLEHQANDCEEYEKQIENLKKEDPIQDCMNDIINQVDAREWRRVNGHRDRMMKKWKREKAKVEEMKDEWEVATEKIGKQNSDLHNEIKRLKKENKDMKQNLDYWMKEAFGNNLLKIQNEKLKKERDEYLEESFQKGFDAGREEYEVDKEYLDEKDKEIERLKKQRDEYLENWKSTTRKYVAVTTRKQRLKALTDK